MGPTTKLWSIGLGVASLLLLAGPVSAAQCPDNMIVVGGTDVGVVSSAATGSVIWLEGPGDQFVPWDATQACSQGCYDLPKGTLVAAGFNTLYGPGTGTVRVADEYVVVGPAGPDLSFEVVLQLTATIDTEGTATAGIGRDWSASQTIQRTTTGMEQTVLPIVVAPGTPFRLHARASAVGGHYEGTGIAKATIRFQGLPSGYVITSCQGFDVPVPTLPTTWGGVKAHYR